MTFSTFLRKKKKSIKKKNLTVNMLFNFSPNWKLRPHFLLLDAHDFFPYDFMEVRYWVMFFHVCVQSWLGSGQGPGILAHSMESLPKESKINGGRLLSPKHTDYYFMWAASLNSWQITDHCIDINDLWDTSWVLVMFTVNKLKTRDTVKVCLALEQQYV